MKTVITAAAIGCIITVMVGGCAGNALEPVEGAITTIEMAKLPAERFAERGEVSAPTRVDGVRCRIVESGRALAFDVDRWWGKTLRPAEGKMYLAVVKYKDTATQPIRFLSYAGLGRYEGPSEMHRFGGCGDGKRKIARVPLAWDMLLSLPSQNGKVRLGIASADGDVPVASISIVPADAGAEARYNAETRDWIARAQSDKRATAVKSQPAVIPPALAGRPIVPYVRSYLSVVYHYSAPQTGEAGAPIRARMTLNEYEPAPFAVYATRDLTGVTFNVGELRGPSGVLAAEITRGTLEYALHAPGRKGTTQFHAQRIWPMYPVDIAEGRSHWFWITLKTDPAKTKPGKYKGTVTITAQEGAATLPMEVEVLPVKMLTMDQAGLEMGGCTPATYPEHEMVFMQRHNINIANLWYSAVGPRLKITGGKMTLDFEAIDVWMKTARKRGMGPIVWFVGGDSHNYPRTLSVEREIYIELHSGGEKTRKQLYSEFTRLAGTKENRGKPMKEIEPYVRQWFREIWKHAKANNWPELIFTPFDEPAVWTRPKRTEATAKGGWILGGGVWVRDHFKALCAIIHEECPGSRIYASIHHNRLKPDRPGRAIKEGECFIPDVEVFCTNAIDEDPKLGDKVRAAGKTFWQYKGIGDGTRPDSGFFGYGLFFPAFDSRGGLLWAYDWGPGMDTSAGTNWMIAWRTPFDVIPSPFIEAFREGWDIRRAIETIKKLAKEKNVDVAPFFKQLYAETKTLRGGWGSKAEYDEWGTAKDLPKVLELHRRVIDKMIELQNR